ncbi:hypothetical protein AGMMS50267_13620 [Spirochaetia bacterium]|nr:hypothetical protein AGMMS50267_13620 [Spirochaetia bacterium]
MEALRKIVPGSALEPLFSLPRSSLDLQYEVLILPVSDVSARCFDDGSLEYLFRGYGDDGIREPLVDFGAAVGNEQW